MVENIASFHRALSSVLSTTRKKKEGNEQLIRMNFTAAFFRYLLDGPIAGTGTVSQKQSVLQLGKDHLTPKVTVFS